MATSSMTLTALSGIPMVKPGDSLTQLVLDALKHNQITLADGDVIVLAQKIVSKAEGRMVNLNDVNPGEAAVALAEETSKDPRLVELILRESNQVLRKRPGLIVVEHRHGYVCANAGIDHSNVRGDWGAHEDWELLLPEDADQTARQVRAGLAEATGKDVAVLVIDSHGRAWRLGTVGISIGTAGVPEIVDRVGDHDLYGYELKNTRIAAADQLAAAASLVMGEVEESIPAVHVRGFPYPFAESSISDVIRPHEKDMFR
ncbi:MAG: coenzyme F420-0:L-glutamate ligase [Anaerolineaceae bacterium]|nr:coenzyme F420-0:L-glutamate ligase [Anaerolineaceae bacterium]